MNDSAVLERARMAFGSDWSPLLESRAPGRLELLGNHIDYNGGPVLAGAINRTVTAYARTNLDTRGTTALFATDLNDHPEMLETRNPKALDVCGSTSTVDYLAGVLHALHERALPVRDGLEIVVAGDVPLGFGMSSSAALCVSLTNVLADTQLTLAQIVDIARRAELLTGAPVGAMDQSASVAGGVILFDGATGEMTPLTPHLEEYVFVVAHSGVSRALNQSAYPARVTESGQALEALRAHGHPALKHLAELDGRPWRLIRTKRPSWLHDPLARRIDHVVSEVERVRRGVEAIEARNWRAFGQLMRESGQSSAISYDISHPVVEQLVAIMNSLPGVLGARMMGGGEGGPALALIHEDAVPVVKAGLSKGFFARHDLDPDSSFEVCSFGPGASLTLHEGAENA